MIERLMELPLYLRANGKYNPNYITKLIHNYRSHDVLLRIPNSVFYDNELIACAGGEVNKAQNWKELPRKKFPLIFHGVDGQERREEYSPR